MLRYVRLWSAYIVCTALFASTSTGFPSSLSAQTLWQGDDLVNPHSWGDVDNWSTGALPTNTQDVIVGAPAPTVVDVFSGQSGTLEVTTAGEIEILSSRTLVVQTGELTNEGLITINSNNGSPAATLSLPNGGTIVGEGDIILAAAGSLANINGTGTVTHGADHTIRGEGWISSPLINNGTITAEDANGDATATLTLLNGAKTNNGVIQSSATADLTVSVAITQGATGRIIADAGTIHLGNAGITSGKLESVNGGVFDTIGNSLPLNQVHLLGQIDMVSGGGVVPTISILGGGITNDGTIVVQSNPPTAGGGTINFPVSGEINGSGEVILNYQDHATITTPVGVDGVNGSEHTIRGVGTISGSITNNGLILAQPRNGGSVLTFNDATKVKTNNNIIRADSGAIVRFTSITMLQSANDGRLIADGGTFELGNAPLNNPSISGGSLETEGAGTIEVTGSARADNVSFNGVLNVQPTRSLTVGGLLTNDGTITLKNSMDALGGAQLILRSGASLGGTGEVILTPDLPSRTNAVSVPTGSMATNAAGHTIRGEGFLNVSGNTGTFINHGALEGTSSSQNIEILAGTLGGSGLLKNVQINANARHNPGNVGGTASVPLQGAYTIAANSELNLEIGGMAPGAGYDQIISTDPANFITIATGGTQLNVSLINGYFPNNGDVFTLIDTVGTLSGNFATINMPILPSGYSWHNLSDTNTIAYQLITAVPGDFDLDGDVDGRDFLAWQRGESPDPFSTADLALWQTEYNGGELSTLNTLNGGGTPPANAMPEPGSFGLLLGLMTTALVVRPLKK